MKYPTMFAKQREGFEGDINRFECYIKLDKMTNYDLVGEVYVRKGNGYVSEGTVTLTDETLGLPDWCAEYMKRLPHHRPADAWVQTVVEGLRDGVDLKAHGAWLHLQRLSPYSGYNLELLYDAEATVRVLGGLESQGVRFKTNLKTPRVAEMAGDVGIDLYGFDAVLMGY